MAAVIPAGRADAIPILRREERYVATTTTTCRKAAPAGTTCSGFVVQAEYGRNNSDPANVVINVSGYALTVDTDGTLNGPAVSTGLVKVGTVNVAGSGRTARLSFTVTLVCLLGPCAPSGDHKFTVSLRKAPVIGAFQSESTSTMSENGSCTSNQLESGSLLVGLTGSGTVRSVSGKQSLRILSDGPQGQNSIGRELTDKKFVGVCL